MMFCMMPFLFWKEMFWLKTVALSRAMHVAQHGEPQRKKRKSTKHKSPRRRQS